MDIILAVDVGSSSVRCTAFSTEDTNVTLMAGCMAQMEVRSVEPNTGHILLTTEDNDHNDNSPSETTSTMDRVDACVDHVINQLRYQLNDGGFRIVGIGFTSFVMNFIAVDKYGEPIGKEFTISYACNASSVIRECQDIRDELGPNGLEELYQITGTPIHSSYALAQLRQLYKSQPKEVLDRIYQWQTISNLCINRWMGKVSSSISYSEASWTGLFNFRHCAYDSTALSLLPPGCQGSLPTLSDFNQGYAGIPKYPYNDNSSSTTSGKPEKNKYWRLWPELRNTPIFLGVGDGACANIGSKCSSSSRISVTIGTSAAARICLRQEVGGNTSSSSSSFRVPRGLFCYRIDQSHVVVGGALTDGGSVVEWVTRLLNLDNEKAFLQCVDEAKQLFKNDCSAIGDEGEGTDDDHNHHHHHHRHGNHMFSFTSDGTSSSPLSMIPFLGGERSTGYRDGATGAILGLTRNTTSAHIFKVCLESVSLRIRTIVELIEEARSSTSASTDATATSSTTMSTKEENGDDNVTSTAPVLIASGMALESNSLWRQMVADSCGLQMILDATTKEGTSRGIARLVAVSLKATATRTKQATTTSATSATSTTSTTSTLLTDETLIPKKISKPRANAQGYFHRAAYIQKNFLDAISPLYYV